MFDDLLRAKDGKTSRRATVLFAAAAHAGAIALAIWWTRPAPAPPPDKIYDGPIGRVIDVDTRGPQRREPAKPQNEGKRPAVRKPARKPQIRPPEPVQPTITIEAPIAKDIPVDEPAAEPDEGDEADGPVGVDSTGPTGGPGGPGTGTIGGWGSGPPRQPDAIFLDGTVPSMSRPRPSPACRPPSPPMPEQARLAGITGRVVVQYVVRPDGSVTGVRSLDPRTPPVLIEAVRQWLEGCPFVAAVYEGRPVAVKMSQSFNFRVQ